MDPVAHSFFGALLAQTGLRRLSGMATATLVIGANLPDIDALATLGGMQISFLLRRGWTHGILALAIWPWLLAGAMVLYDRSRPRAPDALPARFWPLLLLSAIGVFSHSALDWLNTYGIRLLYPFDVRWFYGDTLFIVDPWFWLLAGTPVLIAHSTGRSSRILWVAFAVAASGLLLTSPLVPVAARLVWLAGLGLALALRQLGPDPERVARRALQLLGVYVFAMLAASSAARLEGELWLRSTDLDPEQVYAGPMPANPFSWDVIGVLHDRYVFAEVDFLRPARIAPSYPDEPRTRPDATVRVALERPGLRGTAEWMRFPTFQVEPAGKQVRVRVKDVRYSRFMEGGIGHAETFLEGPVLTGAMRNPCWSAFTKWLGGLQ